MSLAKILEAPGVENHEDKEGKLKGCYHASGYHENSPNHNVSVRDTYYSLNVLSKYTKNYNSI